MFSSSRWAVLLTVAVAFLSGGCANEVQPPVPPPAVPSPPPVTTTPPPSTAATVGEACLYKRPFSPNGPRYSGPGPHPITIDFADPLDVYPSAWSDDPAARISGSLPVVIASYGDWPEGWAVGYDDDDPRLKEIVQLLVCVHPTPESSYVSSDGPTVTCDFIGPDVPFRIVGGAYRVELLEARTGAPVGRFTVPANQEPGPDVCPDSVSLPQGEQLGVILLGMDGTAFTDQLRPYVTDPR